MGSTTFCLPEPGCVSADGIWPAVMRYQTGEFDKAREYLQQVENVDSFFSSIRSSIMASISRILNETDGLDEIETDAKSALADPSLRPSVAMSAHYSLALVAVMRKDLSLGSEQYSALKPNRNSALYLGVGSVDRILGLLAHTMGNLADAQGHFEDAITFCRKAGYRPELAWSLCDYADMLLERKGDGDRKKAVAMLDESLAISTELGMRPLMERVLSRREILKA